MSTRRVVKLTATGKERLEAELTDLRDHRGPQLAARIREATETGNVSDNAEYEEMKEEWATLEARMRDLEQTLANAEVIERDSPRGVVGLGSRVTLRADDGEEATWLIVSPEEANAREQRISSDSPVGGAVMGSRAGDSANVKTPRGVMTYTEVNVD